MDEVDDRPWERPGEVRRDAEPHRGRLLVVLGTVSLGLGILSVALLLPSLIGLPLGVAAWVMARRDLEKMRAGLMDRRGIGPTSEGHNLAFSGVLVNLVAPFFLPGMVLLAWLG